MAHQTCLHDDLWEEGRKLRLNKKWGDVEEGVGLTLQPSQVITP